jgi:hypothetical protein
LETVAKSWIVVEMERVGLQSDDATERHVVMLAIHREGMEQMGLRPMRCVLRELGRVYVYVWREKSWG